jgi:hypothetical protein
MNVDELLEWYGNYLLDDCKLEVWGIRSPADAEEPIAWDAERLTLRIVDWAASIEDKISGAKYYDLRVREADLAGAIERMRQAG